MIKTRIGELARAKGMEKPHQLQKAMRSNSPGVAIRLFNDEVDGLKNRTLDRLCQALDCTPADIYVYQPENGGGGASGRKAAPR